MVKFVSTKIKKLVVHSNPFIKIIGIFLLIARFVKSSDQTIIQTIRKNKSIFPVDTGRKLNVHKASGTSSERLMYVQITSCVYGVLRRLDRIL